MKTAVIKPNLTSISQQAIAFVLIAKKNPPFKL
jgi:hypothetical protein